MEKTFWKNNRDILNRSYPHILEYLEINQEERTSEELGVKGDVSFVEDKTILYASKDGKDYHLDSLYNPNEILDIWYQGIPKLLMNAKIFLFGLGNGMYVRKLMKEA